MLRTQSVSAMLVWLLWSSVAILSGGGGVAQAAEQQECDSNGVCKSVTCKDNVEECSTWSSQGECDANPKYMLKECQKSCFVCGVDDDFDNNPGDGAAYGVPQTLGNELFLSTEALAKERLARANRYMKETEVPADIKAKCRNLHADCTNWAVGGE
jgi:hypothetical protein